jgi:hypothetical protein
VNLYQITYTCLDTWTEQQLAITKSCEVPAPSESQAIEWFEENVQLDYDDIELVEAAQ